MTSIYLAGKIGPDDWRQDVVPGLQAAWGDHDWGSPDWSVADVEWPVIHEGVLNTFNYTGPYFVETCSHSDTGCPQGEHRTWSMCEGEIGERAITLKRCLSAIDRSDVVFAWLDDLTAHGTLTEIGYAKGRGKVVVVASPELPTSIDDLYEESALLRQPNGLGMQELWFAFTLADANLRASTPHEALRQLADANPTLESPIEEAFWQAFMKITPVELSGLKAQHSVLDGRYRIDFALPEEKIGIELDGYIWHSNRKAFTHDRERQRQLELNGWRLIRFSGAEVHRDASECVRQAAQLVASFKHVQSP
ncbi:DUF559 domain-containing protein [Streptomyces sp. A1499]|uniref:DUF559 domain-containing protein n=1 Tax=Streptomyces sp. A1499 TaxID=2563104 RepID=UPI00109EAE24|nr:DUF559 domain-containing protein [Streptomyces sp. A1499]THC47126.1 DUF559 domain-containing protein [Streptomyces sp. A1499]